MKRKSIKCILLIGIMLVSNINMVFAESSDEQYVTVNSHDYSFSNAALSLGLGARARVSVLNEDGTGGIATTGTGGTMGYVRNSDLNPEPKTIEEAIALNKITEIPLYSWDGETVIGVFEFGGESHPIE